MGDPTSMFHGHETLCRRFLEPITRSLENTRSRFYHSAEMLRTCRQGPPVIFTSPIRSRCTVLILLCCTLIILFSRTIVLAELRWSSAAWKCGLAHSVADTLVSLFLRQVDLASARESLCRRLGSRWFTEGLHRNALVTHFQYGQVFSSARQMKDYAVTRCRLHQRAPQR